MPVVIFQPGILPSMPILIDSLDVLAVDAVVVGASATAVTLQAGPAVFSVTGSGFVTAVVNGGLRLTAGTIATIQLTESGVDVYTMTGVGLSAAALHAEGMQEVGINFSGEVEGLVSGLGYTFTGSNEDDIHLVNTRSADFALLNFRGNDRFTLLGGEDNFWSGDGNDWMNGGTGNDTLDGGRGQDVLIAASGNDEVNGGEGNDRLFGVGGRDLLYGGEGDDTLMGGAGNDVLNAGLGRDILYGEGGADNFQFFLANEAGNGSNRDQIRDFVSGEDTIFMMFLGPFGTFLGSGPFTGAGNEVRLFVSGGNGFLLIDDNGDRLVDTSIQLVGVTSVTAADLLLS